MRADIHDGPEQTLQSEAGYSNARPRQPSRRNLLQRTAGPYTWVKRYRVGAHREPLNVRFAPRATELLRRREMSRWVIFDRDGESSTSRHVRYASKSDHSRHQSKLSPCTAANNNPIRSPRRHERTAWLGHRTVDSCRTIRRMTMPNDT